MLRHELTALFDTWNSLPDSLMNYTKLAPRDHQECMVNYKGMKLVTL